MGQINTTKRTVGYKSPAERLAKDIQGCGNCKHSYTGNDLSLNCRLHGFYVSQMAICKKWCDMGMEAGL
jgi:hypothetical protein